MEHGSKSVVNPGARKRWAAWLAAGVGVLLASHPAAAKEITVVADTAPGYSYVCGSPAVGLTAVLTDDAYTCVGAGELAVTGSASLGTYYGATYGANTVVRGKELLLQVETAVAGDLIVELGYAAVGPKPTDFVRFSTGNRYVTVSFGRSTGFTTHRIDLRKIWGTVPAGNRLAIRLMTASSTFSGKVKLSNASGDRSLQLTYFENAYAVPGDFATIAAAVAAVPADAHIFLADQTWAGRDNDTVTINKPLTLTSENGPDGCVVDGRYGAGRFSFTAGATDRTVIEGITFVHFSPAILINASASPVIRNCVFRDCLVTTGGGLGGAVQILDGSGGAVEIEHCLFESNVAAFGGAIGLANSTGAQRHLVVRDSVFRGNFAQGGGAIGLYDTSTQSGALIQNCNFLQNNAEDGGAISILTAAEEDILDCWFEENGAFDHGGAIYTTKVGGSGIKTISNSIFRGNSARLYGGGALYTDGASVNHCDLLENAAGGDGGAIATTGPLFVYNSILRGNTEHGTAQTGKAIYVDATGSLSLGYSNVERGTGGIGYHPSIARQAHTYVGVIDPEPQFLSSDSLQLLPTSPCVEAGMASPPLPAGSTIVSADADGVPHAQSPTCGAGAPDLGAYGYHGACGDAVPEVAPKVLVLTARQDGSPPDVERLIVRNASETALSWRAAADVAWLRLEPAPAQGEVSNDSATVSVHADVSGLEAGVYQGKVVISSSATNAQPTSRTIPVILHVTRIRRVPAEYSSIQSAINAAMSGDEVVVAAGRYAAAGDKNLDLRGRALVLRSETGRDATVVDCDGSGRGLTHEFGPPGAVLEGFTFTGCNSPAGGDGGGIYVGRYATLEIVDCLFLDNRLTVSGGEGGGVYADGRVTISNCEFRGNVADYRGGGVFLGSNARGSRIQGCEFSANSANDGGGIFSWAPDLTLLGCTFSNNTVPYTKTTAAYGGGAYLMADNTEVNACWFQANTATNGGGLYLYDTDTARMSRVVSSVFYDNTARRNGSAASSSGGGAYVAGSGCEVVNSTFYSNQQTGPGEDFGGGGLYDGSGSPAIRNCVFVANTAYLSYQDVSANNISHCIVEDWSDDPARNLYGGDTAASVFVAPTANPPNLRLRTSSRAVDTGATIDDVFSDFRGSVRAVDGREEPVTLGAGSESTSGARFDLGAYEYSEHYGGATVDGVAKAFKNLRINGAIVATGYEYRIQWDTKDPFPEQMDPRVRQRGEYDARLLLVTDAGRRVELGTWKMELGVGYTIPFTFGAAHVGTWRLRLEMASDPNQYVLSELFPIQYKELVTYTLGRRIDPPAGALSGQRPDVNNPEAVYWSTETNALYAIAPYPIQLTWFADKDRTIPILVMGIIQTPADPVFHVAEGPPVELRPEGTRFGAVGILWSDSSAQISSDRFTAPQDGWTTLLFKDAVNANPELRELFTVVRTLTWDHRGSVPARDPFYPGPPLPPVDPIYPIEKAWEIGVKIFDDEHEPFAACSGGHVLNEISPYDGAGDDRAYDRPTRSGQIFAVNEDDPRTEDDDLVVIWYRRQGDVADGDPGVCWPFKPVRYDPTWPALGEVCPGSATCNVIEIAGKLEGDPPAPGDPDLRSRVPNGSGALLPDAYGAWDNISVYNQPDLSLPGFNPNEEHAMLFPAEGTPYPGAFPLRSDINNDVWNDPPFDRDNPAYTSPPAVLVKYRDPLSGEWRFRVFHVDPGDLAYSPEAGNEFNPPYPLNQFVFGPCRAGQRLAQAQSGTWTDAELYKDDGSNMSTAEALMDKDMKLFSFRGAREGDPPVLVRIYQFYRLQPGFWFDRDYNGWPDKPPGTCVPLLDALDGNENQLTPAPITYTIVWPETPTLYVGETLADAKMQDGETVGLPNVKDQCIVAKLWDEAGVRLFDPLKEFRYPDPDRNPPDDPEALLVGELKDKDNMPLKTDPPTPVGSRVAFRDLPPQLQQRLTYDAVTYRLKLKGEYITTTGEPVLMLNTLSLREREGIKAALNLAEGSALLAAVDVLRARGDANLAGPPPNGLASIARWQADFKAVSAGNVSNTGFVTLAFNNHADCPAPTTLKVIEVDCPLYRGDLKVVESPNPFEEKVTLRHNGDFGGKPDDRYFEWVYLQGYSGIPEGPGNDNGENWLPFNKDNSAPGPTQLSPLSMSVPVEGEGTHIFNRGLVDITPLGTGQQLLPDRWFATRYYYSTSLNYHADPPYEVAAPTGACTMVSPWTPPQLAEGWVKRVMKKINLFDQRVKDFHKTDADTVASMIAQSGRAYEGDVALSDEPEYLKRVGLIELYETLLNRALALSLDADPVDASLRDAVLFAANRLASLYMLLGNEAYADSADPTIGFGTQDGQYGAMASSIFAFQNQMDTLLDEEFALLAGRDDEGMRPFYNRVPWNFTIADGEVAYRQVYNIQDVADATGAMEPDGEINEYDAKFLFPQGHGDAWGHYLSAIKRLYYLITHDASDLWVPTVEAILVAQAPVEVDYRDERLFATAAAARARSGADLVNLAYRRFYDEDPESQWLGYRDSNANRNWGLAEWGSRAGQGAYIDWAVGNALLPSVSTEIRKVESFPAPLEMTYVLGPDYAQGSLQVFVDPDPEGTKPPEPTASYKVELREDPEKGVSRTWISFDPLVTGYPGPLPLPTQQIVFRVTLPAEGIKKVDRTTVVDLHEIAGQFDAIQSVLDQADAGLNPLGVAKDTVPFDIDPALVAAGQTHFEQIYNRALQTLQNAATVFDYAGQSSQMLRRQQDRLDDFKRTIEDREADFTSRLVEVFGYPYPEDCGPGKLYPTGYCETGPDLYHYMYVDPSKLMGAANTTKTATTAPRELEFTMTFRELTVEPAGGLTEREIPVKFTVDEDRRFGIIRPAAWTGNRRAPGALQLARADLLQLQGRFERAILEYDALIEQVRDQAALLQDLYRLNADEILVLQEAKGTQQSINDSILNARDSAISSRASAQDAIFVANVAMEAIPKVLGLATDGMSAARGIALGVGQGISLMLNQEADRSQVAELSSQQSKEIAGAEANIRIVTRRGEFAVQQQILQLENLVRREAVLRQELYTLVEGLQQSAGRFLNTIAAGDRILEERLRFRKQTAAQVQDYRYTDMTFRVFRNDALQKYKAQLDLAGRYAYLAAKAYDYETTLLDASGMAGRAFLTGIVKERSIGTVLGGQPLAGTGLADVLRRLAVNFQVLKPQLGFNNPQVETNRFSLRRELFRVRFDEGSDGTWRDALAEYRKDDLWDVPEFRRYCRPFAAEGVPQPGLVIPFRTTVTSGLNFFGWPLGGGDSYYSAANFATKVRSVGVWFSNYNATGLAQTPRVYLVPTGEDVLRSPTGGAGEIRSWHVLDQRLPTPQLVTAGELAGDRAWIPAVDTILDEFGAPRRHADFKAYHDSGYLEPSEMTYDTRLVGRSVWNTKWMLIIPGRNLLYDPEEGLEMFINGPEVYGGAGERTGNGISDIKLFFTTYAYSGY